MAARPWNPCLKKTTRLTLTCLGWAACLYGLSRLAPVFLTPRVIEIDDFPEYWSAGRLNLQGKNPYAADLMEALQRPIGRTPTVMMWNLAFAAVGVNLAALGLRKLWNNDAAYWWLAPAWLIWFLGFSRWVGTPIWAPDLDSRGEGKNTLERDAIRHGAD
jgi:hypothetical protein